MNHFQDIDDGLSEFEANQARIDDEAFLRTNPSRFQITGIPGNPRTVSVTEVGLLGDRCPLPRNLSMHPRMYDAGYAILVLEGYPTPVALRWTDYGKVVSLSWPAPAEVLKSVVGGWEPGLQHYWEA